MKSYFTNKEFTVLNVIGIITKGCQIFLNIFLKEVNYKNGIIVLFQQDWAFVARFCFLSHYGRFEYSIEYSKVCFLRLKVI